MVKIVKRSARLARRRFIRLFGKDDSMTIRIQDGELSAAVPIHFRAPFDRHVLDEAIVFFQYFIHVQPDREFSGRVILVGLDELNSDLIPAEKREGGRVFWECRAQRKT